MQIFCITSGICFICIRNIPPFTGWTMTGTASSGSTPTMGTEVFSPLSAEMKQENEICSLSLILPPWSGQTTGLAYQNEEITA